MEADVRNSVKDFHRNKNLEIQLVRVPFSPSRKGWVSKNGESWPVDGKRASFSHAGCGDSYLNPEPNSRNMEFDPKQNLFKNLPPLERVTAP